VGFGVPGVEISRLADERGADLVLLGRRARSPTHRLLLGETADALVRRAQVPVLSIPQEVGAFGCVLVAMDGNERGFALLPTAVELARATGACLQVVTVEPEPAHEPARAAPTPPLARSLRVGTAVAGVPPCGPRD